MYGCACESPKHGGAVEPWGISDRSSCAPRVETGGWSTSLQCVCVLRVTCSAQAVPV
jgi:hypothetical protein